MKKLLFIEANTTGTGMIAIQKTKELNLEPVFLTSNPQLYTDLAKQDCEVIICDTNNVLKIIETIDSNFKEDEIKGITTTSDFYINTVSLLIENYNLYGNPSDVTRISRNKAAVRELLRESSILYQPSYYVIKSLEELTKIKKKIDFPCIVKPVDDSGSNGVLKCDNFETLNGHIQILFSIKTNARNQKKENLILIEEFVEGDEYSVETFSYKGHHQLIGITSKTVSESPYFVEKGHVYPAYDIQSKKVSDAVMEILTLIKWETGPAHIEIKIKDNKVFLVEFNGRLAGGMIPILINHAQGLDLLTEQLKAAVGIEPNLKSSINKFAGIHFLTADKSGTITCVIGLDSIKNISNIKEIKCTVKPGEKVKQTTNATGRFGHIIMSNPDYSELMKTFQLIQNKVKFEIKEENTNELFK